MNPSLLQPLAGPPAEFPLANTPLAGHQAAAVQAAGPPPARHHPDAWLDASELAALDPAGPTTLLADDATPLAWLGDSPDPDSAIPAESSFLIIHPWDLLRANELAVGAIYRSAIDGRVHPAAVIEGTLHLGPGSQVLPGVMIEGNVVIGANCRIGPNCYLRGATSIGDHCLIGQAVEIKNSIILSNTLVGHLSYLGDSILGHGVNIGAGTIVSNFRHDAAHHRSMAGGSLVDTGRLKFGTIVGDRVQTGIHTSIYPGRKLWPGTTTRPGQVVEKDLAGDPE